MEEEVVRRRGWLTREAFLDLVGASQLIPGPNSSELAMHIGFARARWAGLVVAGLAFILPAMAIVWVIAWGYARFGALPAAQGILFGVKPVVIAVVAHAVWSLGRTALTSAMTVAIFAASTLALLLGVNEIVVLGAAGLVALVDRRVTRGGDLWRSGMASTVPSILSAGGTSWTAATLGMTTTVAAASLSGLFLVFAKIGALLFGSGYVLVAFLEADLVERLGWLTRTQLLDAVAVGQFTPGPLFTTATFVGYVVAGNGGALVATAGIFLPAFVFVALTAPILERWRTHEGVRALLDGVNAASLALLASVTVMLAVALVGGQAGSTVPRVATAAMAVALFAASLWLMLRRRVSATWLLAGGAVTGSLLQLLGLTT